MICRIVVASALLFPSIALADPVGVSGASVYVTKSDCMALVRHHPSADATYQPGADVHGKYVPPADMPGSGVGIALPDKVEFDLKINPMNYVKGQQAGSVGSTGSSSSSSSTTSTPSSSSTSSPSPSTGASSAAAGQYANTAMPVARIGVDLKSGQTYLNGRPLDGEQDVYVLDACRKAGFR